MKELLSSLQPDEECELYILWIRLVSLKLYRQGILSKNLDVTFHNGKKYNLSFLTDLIDYVRLDSMCPELINVIIPELRNKVSATTSRTRILSETPSGGIVDWSSSSLRCKYPYLIGDFHILCREINHDLPENRLITQILINILVHVEQALQNIRALYCNSSPALGGILKLRNVLIDVLRSTPFLSLKKNIGQMISFNPILEINQFPKGTSKVLPKLVDWYKRLLTLNFVRFKRFNTEEIENIPPDDAVTILTLLLLADAISSHYFLRDKNISLSKGELFKSVESGGINLHLFFNCWPLKANPPKKRFVRYEPDISLRVSDGKRPPQVCGLLFVQRVLDDVRPINEVRRTIKRYIQEYRQSYPKH
ncbi:MAG: hypothetical protein ACFFFH_18575, partial [Candidatus Thorarchaeota archaeon]